MKVSTAFLPTLESAHGIAAVLKRAPKMRPDQLIIANLSGRGDKDVAQAAEFLIEGKKPLVPDFTTDSSVFSTAANPTICPPLVPVI